MSNHLKDQTSPYLLQHAENPVEWYPWCDEAFQRARDQDKPVFLSIGYSTCHWCHVMARESFEDGEIADILNKSFVCVKVDREERPDIDSVYMSVCQAFTGSGGWPTSIFMTAEQKPFFAGTYFPKSSRRGAPGLKELLEFIAEKWRGDRDTLLEQAEDITAELNRTRTRSPSVRVPDRAQLLDDAVSIYRRGYDSEFGGFGGAPKFPAPHNLIFLMTYYKKYGDPDALKMAEGTLVHMYSGGIFDHIGYGLCRYSTDRYFLVPHFEKMLYDNALLILACCKAYEVTKKLFYRDIAEKTAFYILNEMTSEDGAFFSAQDADSDAREGKYYLFEPEEIIRLLGERDGARFNQRYGITQKGNFEGKNIPNLLHGEPFADDLDVFLPKIRAYRRERTRLSTDDKILTSWNALTIAAMCALYRTSGRARYLDAARRAQSFLDNNLFDGGVPCVSFRGGRRGGRGFLDDFAGCVFALIALYDATLDGAFLDRARQLAHRTVSDFFDGEDGGFYVYGGDGEALISRPKDTYDGAAPCGNSLMAYSLVRLCRLSGDARLEAVLEKQMDFMCSEAEKYPAGCSMFLTALSDFLDPPPAITVAAADPRDIRELPLRVPSDSLVLLCENPSDEYPLVNQKTTFYVCRGKSCLPPTNELVLPE